MRGALLAGLALAIALLAAGCGYSTGIRVGDRVKSLGVTYFLNSTLEPDVERDLQNAITASVRSLTDVRLADPGTAEVVMRGVIREYRFRGGIRSADNQLLETGLFIEAEAGLYDRSSDRALGPQKVAHVWIGYTVDQPAGESDARQRAIRFIADQLVLDLFSPLE